MQLIKRMWNEEQITELQMEAIIFAQKGDKLLRRIYKVYKVLAITIRNRLQLYASRIVKINAN